MIAGTSGNLTYLQNFVKEVHDSGSVVAQIFIMAGRFTDKEVCVGSVLTVYGSVCHNGLSVIMDGMPFWTLCHYG
jgi:hypothetical protein